MNKDNQMNRKQNETDREINKIMLLVQNGKYEQAYSQLVHLAKSGHPSALKMVSDWYRNGIYLKQSFTKAFEFATKALDAGYEEKEAHLLEDLSLLISYKQQLENKDPGSLLIFGEIYKEGVLLEKNDVRAVDYFLQALDNNNFLAITRLEEMCEEGSLYAFQKMFQLRKDTSSTYYDPMGACDLSSTLLALNVDKTDQAREYLIEEANKGNVYASYLFGKHLFTASTTLDKQEEGVKRIEMAKDQYPALVLPVLAAAYQLGRGVQKNERFAQELMASPLIEEASFAIYEESLTCASNQGDGNAALSLARKTLLAGVGHRNRVEAAKLVEEQLSEETFKDRILLLSYYRDSDEDKVLMYLADLLARKQVEPDEFTLKEKVNIGLFAVEFFQDMGSYVTSMVRELEELVLVDLTDPQVSEYAEPLLQASLQLADLYMHHEKVARKYKQAVFYYEQGLSYEMLSLSQIKNLAFCYLNGLGTNKDVAHAMELYHFAAEQRDPKAALLIGNCYRYGFNGYEQDPKIGALWYELAAEEGEADAWYALSLCYSLGIGRDKDETRGEELLQRAKEQGSEDALKALGKVEIEQEYRSDTVTNHRDKKQDSTLELANQHTPIWDLIESAVYWGLGLFFQFMHKELTPEIKKSSMEFIKFGFVGVTNTIISYVLYAGCLLALREAGLFTDVDYLLAQIFAFVLSVLWSYILNTIFVFPLEQGEKRPFFSSLLKTYLSYAFTGLFLNSILLFFWVQVVHLSEFIAPIINLLVSVPINFLMNKFWAFKKKSV